MNATILGPDGRSRCRWSGAAPEFFGYHDTEWGFPVSDDHRLFEKLSLEGFQSGLSWRTILAKRENFRATFHDFDVDRIARSKSLKQQGFAFVGPTTVYAFMQAMGLINDHVEDCVIRAKVERARKI